MVDDSNYEQLIIDRFTEHFPKIAATGDYRYTQAICMILNEYSNDYSYEDDANGVFIYKKGSCIWKQEFASPYIKTHYKPLFDFFINETRIIKIDTIIDEGGICDIY